MAEVAQWQCSTWAKQGVTVAPAQNEKASDQRERPNWGSKKPNLLSFLLTFHVGVSPGNFSFQKMSWAKQPIPKIISEYWPRPPYPHSTNSLLHYCAIMLLLTPLPMLPLSPLTLPSLPQTASPPYPHLTNSSFYILYFFILSIWMYFVLFLSEMLSS